MTRGTCDQHGTPSAGDGFMGNAPEQEHVEASRTARPENDQVCVHLVRCPGDLLTDGQGTVALLNDDGGPSPTRHLPFAESSLKDLFPNGSPELAGSGRRRRARYGQVALAARAVRPYTGRCTGGTLVQVDSPATYLHWGFILISLPNLVLIGVMIALFVLALVLPFPGHREKPEPPEEKRDE